MSFDDDDWGHAQQGSGEYARVDSLAGRLLIIFPIGYIEHSPTRFSQPGKPSDVVVCDVIDLDDVDEGGNPGKIYRTAWWRPSKIVVTLRQLIGKKTLGRIGKGMAQNGMNPPWVVNDAYQEPGALDRARAWAQANPNFTVSMFTPPAQFSQQPSNGFGPQQPQQYTPGVGYQGPARQQQYVQPPAPQQPQYQQQGPPPGYQQQPQFQPQPSYGPPPQPQYQQPAPAQQYQQQGPPQQQPQAYPVQGAQQQDAGMLELMRAERERREAQNAQSMWQDQPPF